MGTWGIARDMAKLNEENLKKLSRKGMYDKLKARGFNSPIKIYRFKKASPEVLKAIREKMKAQNLAIKRRNRVLGIISCAFVLTLVFILALIQF